MRLTSTVFADWLSELVTTGARVYPGRLPDMPARAISVEMQQGAGLTMDGLLDVVSFHISSRGAENNFVDAEDIAFDIDNIMIGNTTQSTENFSISVGSDSVYVSDIGRSGGGPVQSSILDSQTRWVFTCNYYAIVSTNVGQVN